MVLDMRHRAPPLTSESLATLADEAVELVDAGAGVLAGAWRAVVAVLVAVLADPAGLAVAAVPTKQTQPIITRAVGSAGDFEAPVKVIRTR